MKKEELKKVNEQICNLVENMQVRFTKFIENDNKAAGTDVRKAMMEIATLCKQGRALVSDIKNGVE